MSLYDLSPPPVEPVDLAEAKTWLRVDTTDEDALITALIMAARHRIENYLRRSLINRAYIWRTCLPVDNFMCLPRPPLVSITRLSLIGETDQAVDIPASDYEVITRREPGELHLTTERNWTDYLSGFATLEVEFVAGYGTQATDVPTPIRQALRLLLGQYYEFREARPDAGLPDMVAALLAPYREIRL